jgi:FeS assembly SUF system protein
MESKRIGLPVMGEQPTAGPPGTTALPADAPLDERVIAVLKAIYDPEIPVNIHELGLIYDLKIDPPGEVAIKMTLTSPGCPVAMSLVGEVQAKVAALPGVIRASVDLVWDPPWDRSRMSEEAALLLGLD